MRRIGHERWRRIAVERGDAGLRDVVDDVAVLLLERGGDREDAFDEATAGGAVGAPAPFAPEDRRPQRALRGVVRRVDLGHVHEGPASRRHGEEIATGGGRGRGPAPGTAAEPTVDAPLQRPPGRLELRAAPFAGTTREIPTPYTFFRDACGEDGSGDRPGDLAHRAARAH